MHNGAPHSATVWQSWLGEFFKGSTHGPRHSTYLKKPFPFSLIQSRLSAARSLLTPPHSQLTSSHDHRRTASQCALHLDLSFLLPPAFIHHLTQRICEWTPTTVAGRKALKHFMKVCSVSVDDMAPGYGFIFYFFSHAGLSECLSIGRSATLVRTDKSQRWPDELLSNSEHNWTFPSRWIVTILVSP